MKDAEAGQYRCPRCGVPMDHPPRDYNICPNRECFIEFGYDAPEFNDNGTYASVNEDLLHVVRGTDSQPVDPWWRKFAVPTHQQEQEERQN